MIQIFNQLAFIVPGLIVTFVHCHNWNYECKDPKGMLNWGKYYPQCNGKKQSPVNIDTSKVKIKTDLNFNLGGLDYRHETWLRNNGHSTQLNLLDSPKPNLTGNAVNGVYEFAQLHLHWGESSRVGSEHSINDLFYSAELHMVFSKKDYCSVDEALNHEDGLVVLGVFLKASKINNPNFDPLVYAVHQATEYNAKAFLPTGISLSSLLPKNLSKFYTYQGSLTSPYCNEAVTWILLADPIEIGEQQLQAFRSTKMNYFSYKSLSNRNIRNYRYRVPLNGRIVKASFNPPAKEPIRFSFPCLFFKPIKTRNSMRPLIDSPPSSSMNEDIIQTPYSDDSDVYLTWTS